MTINTLSDLDTIYQLRAHWIYHGEPAGECSWSFWSQRDSGLTLTELADAWLADLGPRFITRRPSLWTLDEVRVEDRWPHIQPSLVLPFPLGDPHPEDFVGVPPQCTPVISWRTGEPGRSYRGRTYYGPGPIDDVFYENVEGGFNDAVFDFATAMIEQFGPGGTSTDFRFVIVSRRHDGAPSVPGQWAPVTSFLYNFKWAVMRRRGLGWWADPYFSHH